MKEISTEFRKITNEFKYRKHMILNNFAFSVSIKNKMSPLNYLITKSISLIDYISGIILYNSTIVVQGKTIHSSYKIHIFKT